MVPFRIPQDRKQKVATYDKFISNFLIITGVIVLSCTTTDYVGKKYSKTDRVEKFFNTNKIKREYEVMRQMKAEVHETVKFEVMELQLEKDDMEKGANAILIGELKTVEIGSATISFIY